MGGLEEEGEKLAFLVSAQRETSIGIWDNFRKYSRQNKDSLYSSLL